MRSSSAMAIQEWIVAWLAERGEAIDGRDGFSRHGLTSLTLIGLASALEHELDRPVSPTLLWKYRSPQALAAHLAGETTAVRTSPGDAAPDHEPVAVVGLSCRFPGAPGPGAYWRLLSGGLDAITDVPAGRWDADAARSDPRTERGGFLDSVDLFDPEFFGISPREAAHIDPQQRLMLELAWEALEDAGLPPRGLDGSRTGVFVGAMWNEYGASRWGQADLVGQHTTAGNDPSIIPARVSYTFGLTGPSFVVNTACSSSLLAVHLAHQSLLRGECDLAIAGGVSLMLDPNTMTSLSAMGALSPEGRSKAFDASADGYGRGEGGGVIVLKRLRRALADGDPVYCVIRGGAVNNDGGGNSLTAPSPQAQEAVLRDAYARAGVDPLDVQYVEAHGTGTRLGDPIEAEALSAVLCAGRPAERALRLGSVKANIGHLEAAAGIAGVIKVALAMRHGALPPSAGYERPNPHIPFDDWRLRVLLETEEWSGDEEGRLLAGVSGFGFGGTNCHLVLEGVGDEPAWLVPVEADTPDRLRSAVRVLAEAAAGPGRVPPDRTTAESGGGHRLALSVRSQEDLIARAGDFLAGRAHPGIFPGRPGRGRPKVVFAFGGQGAQWPAMGVRLMRQEPAFRAALSRCDEAMRPYAAWSLLDVLCGDDDAWLESTAVAQPAIFALQVALAELWRSRGVEPDAVVGMSMGEVAAAHVAGALDLDDAARLMCLRSRVTSRLSGRGAMAVAECAAERVRTVLGEQAGEVWVAGEAGPRSTVLTGDRDALERVLAALARDGARCGWIRVDYGSHSPYVEGVREEFLGELAWVRPRSARIPFHSSVTGGPLEGGELTAAHWWRTERDPWLFSSAVRGLLDEGHDVFVDLDPHPVLLDAVRQGFGEGTAASGGPVTLPSLRRDDRGRSTLTDSLGALYARGAALVRTDESERIAVVSGRTPEALQEAAHALADRIEEAGDTSLGDISHTSTVRRTHHEHRLAVVGRTAGEMAGSLRAAVRGETRAAAAFGHAGEPRPPVFVFSGQGSQWAGMGRDLLDREPAFRRVVEECDELLRPLAGWSLTAELRASEDTGRLGRTSVAQPALFAVEVALAALWETWGITPGAVIGHSVGEVAAAHLAGVVGLEDAIRIVHHRGRFMERAAGLGRMAAADLPVGRARSLAAEYGPSLAIAAVNDPGSVVFSGAPEALAELLGRLREEGVYCRDLGVDYAFHSAQMAPFHDELAQALDGLRLGEARLPIYGTVSGGPLQGPEMDGGYWADNVRDTVRFADAVAAALAAGHRDFLEVGPHPVLLGNIEECLSHAGAEGRAVGSLRRRQEGYGSLLRTAGALFADGHPVEWSRIAGEWGRCVPLPAYSWQRRRYWLSPPWSGERAARPSWGDAGHPLLGTSLTSSLHPGTTFWQASPSAARSPYLTAMNVRGETVLSAAAYVEMALSAGARLWPGGPVEAADLIFEQLLTVTAGDEPTLQSTAEEREPGRADFQVSSRAGDVWVRHARGTVRQAAPHGRAEAGEPLEWILSRCSDRHDGAEHYRRLAERGLDLGEPLRGVREIRLGKDEALGRIALPAESPPGSAYQVHPATLDSCLQVIVALCDAAGEGDHVLTSVDRLRLDSPLTGEFWAHARLREGTAGEHVGDLRLIGGDGRELGAAEGLRLRPLPPAAPSRDSDDPLYALAWRDAGSPPADSGRLGTWLVLADRGGTARALVARLRLEGRRCVLALPHEMHEPREPGGSYEPDGPGAAAEPDVHRLDPEDPGAVAALLREVFGDVPPAGVVHLGGLDAAAPGVAASGAEPIAAAAGRAAVGVLHTARALSAAGWRDTPRLWLVTRGAQAVGAGAVSVAQAPLWGLGRVIGTEHPELTCTRVDLDPGSPEDGSPALCRELLADQAETDIALRDGARLVLRLVRSPESGRTTDTTGADRTEDGTHLIVGGSPELVSALTDRLAGEVVVVHPDAVVSADPRVRVVRADVSQPGVAAQVLAGIDRLRGIVYADGDEAAVEDLTAEGLSAGLTTVVSGAWNLHALTAGHELDFFVSWSSAASLLGYPGQGVRAATGAFLDALAAHRRHHGLRATGVASGPVGPRSAAAGHARLSAQGVQAVVPADCDLALERIAAGPEWLAVLRLNARHWVQTHPGAAASPLLSELLAEPRAAGGAGAPIRVELAGLPVRERRVRLEDHLRDQLALTLQQDPARLNRLTTFRNMGLESLMAVELRNRLEVGLGTRLSVALLFTCSTIAALADHVLIELGLDGADAEPDAPPPDPGASSADATEPTGLGSELELDIEALSDEEAEQLLLRSIQIVNEGSPDE